MERNKICHRSRVTSHVREARKILHLSTLRRFGGVGSENARQFALGRFHFILLPTSP